MSIEERSSSLPLPFGASSYGVGGPEANLTHLVMALNVAAQVLAASNRVGEQDYGHDIP